MRDIWNWSNGQDIWITTSQVPGVKNTTGDLRSGLFYNNKEWSLNERVAKSLFDQFGKPEIGLFASRLSTKCTKYASYKPDPDVYHVNNAFSLFWLDLNSYIFPSFSVVGRVLAQILQDRLTALVIVLCDSQLWFPQFVLLAIPGTIPPLIPAHQHLLQLPERNLESAQSGSSNFVGQLPTNVTLRCPDHQCIMHNQHTTNQ